MTSSSETHGSGGLKVRGLENLASGERGDQCEEKSSGPMSRLKFTAHDYPLLQIQFKLKVSALMALGKEKIETYRKTLTLRRETLAEDLRQATAQLINDESSYTDSVDQAAADTDKSFTLQMKNRDRDILWQIDEAIKRLDGGSFGECERCDEPISEGRIEAFPFTTLCIDCKAELESEEHRFPGRN